MNTASETTQAEIGGYRLVSYFEKGRAELGYPDHAVDHDGKVFHLASAARIASSETIASASSPEADQSWNTSENLTPGAWPDRLL